MTDSLIEEVALPSYVHLTINSPVASCVAGSLVAGDGAPAYMTM
jgi:hypothetical protein